MFVPFALSLLIASAAADITGTALYDRTCLCGLAASVAVRDSACGTAIAAINPGQCFLYTGSLEFCEHDGVEYSFYSVNFRGLLGWVAGNYLSIASSEDCAISVARAKDCDDGCPRIVSREAWGAIPPRNMTSESNLILSSPLMGANPALRHPIQRVFIAHTGQRPCNSSADCSNAVKTLQLTHVHDNGWPDIGYNFVIGEDGKVYEGRGWNRVGAHVLGHNGNSISIAVIGDFEDRQPSSAAIGMIRQLIKCGVTKEKLSMTYTIHGVRDGVCDTTSPGRAFYGLINTWSDYGGKLPTGSC